MTRTDSPEPPPRPLASLDGIFAAAALPEDHPHALRFDKKAELDASIIRSPNIAEKIRANLRRKSVGGLSEEGEDGLKVGREEEEKVGSLGSETVYDGDARRITSGEVAGINAEQEEQGGKTEEVSAGAEKAEARYASSSASKAEVRSSVLGSAEYLRPLFEKPVPLLPP